MSRACLLLLLLASGCASGGFDPMLLAPDEPWIVAVKSAGLPGDGPLSLAHHGWFDIKRGSEDGWIRLEVMNNGLGDRSRDHVREREITSESARRQKRWGHPVHLLGLVTGEEACVAGERLLGLAKAYPDAWTYWAVPGPNSNSFVERLGRDTPELTAELHHNMVGKDFAWFLSAGLSPTGTGVQLETPLAGLQLGLDDGVQLHLLGFTIGVDFWPPALLLPGLPRLGFPSQLESSAAESPPAPPDAVIANDSR